MAGIPRPAGHVDFLQYLEDAKPALDIAAAMLDREYFLFAYPISTWHRVLALPRPVDTTVLFGTWLAYADAQIRFLDEVDEGIDTFNTIFNVLKMYSQKSSYRCLAWYAYYKTLISIARNTEDVSVINKMEDMINLQPLPFEDMKRVLHDNLRVLDETILSPDTLTSYGDEFSMDFKDHIELKLLNNTVRFLKGQLTSLEAMIDHLPNEYHTTWMNSVAWYEVPYTADFDSQYALLIIYELTGAHYTNTMHNSALLVFSIERFKLGLVNYPENLKQLMPEYVESVLVNPMTDSPFVYERIDELIYRIQSEPMPNHSYDGSIAGSKPYKYVEANDFPDSVR